MIRPITLLTLALVSAGLVSAQSTLPTAPGPQLLSSLQQPQAMASPAAAQTPPPANPNQPTLTLAQA
ncbi:MAG: hypothetical protein WA399_05865, partial [Acidobacteriaceae bacterium]